MSFLWIFIAPSIQNEPGYTDFIEKTVNAHLSGCLNDLTLFELNKTYQLVGNTTTRNTTSLMVDTLLRRNYRKTTL